MTVLDEPTYMAYGGWTGTATRTQVSAALQYADTEAVRVIGAPLWTQMVTDTYALTPMLKPFYLLQTPVLGLVEVNGIWGNGESGTVCLELLDSGCGLVQPYMSGTFCGGNFSAHPKRVDVTYYAGLMSGTYTSDPGTLAALSAIAKEFLRQMIDPSRSEGGEGAPGVQQFTSGKYTEVRTKLKNTSLGASSLMNWAYDRLKKWRRPRAGRL